MIGTQISETLNFPGTIRHPSHENKNQFTGMIDTPGNKLSCFCNIHIRRLDGGKTEFKDGKRLDKNKTKTTKSIVVRTKRELRLVVLLKRTS